MRIHEDGTGWDEMRGNRRGVNKKIHVSIVREGRNRIESKQKGADTRKT